MDQRKRLASYILAEYFGEVTETVFCALLDRGKLTLKELGLFTKITRQQIQECLTSLILHNFVEFTEDSGPAVYSALVENVFLFVRYPRYILTARRLFGVEGQQIVQCLLKNGRMTFEAAVDAVANEAGGGEEYKDRVRVEFVKMVRSHMLMRALAPDDITNNNDPTNRDDSIYDLPPGAEIYLEDSSNKRSLMESDDDMDAKPRLKKRRGPKPSQGLDLMSEVTVNADGLWRVNFNQMHVSIRNEAIVDYVCRRIDLTAGDIVRSILTQTELKESPAQRKTGKTTSVTRFKILEGLPDSPGFTNRELDYYLELLCGQAGGIVKKIDEQAGGRFVIDLDVAVGHLRSQVLESVVQEKYGSQCCRIYRLVVAKKLLEQKQISDMVMIPFKEAKEFSYKLLTAGYLQLQEVPRTADHAPSRTFFLLRSHTPSVVEMVITNMIRALGNFAALRKAKASRFSTILEKVERNAHAGENLMEADLSTLVGLKEGDKLTATKLQKTLSRLAIGSLQIDQSIMILRDF